MTMVGGTDKVLQPRIFDEVNSVDVLGMQRHGFMVFWQIVDEHRAGVHATRYVAHRMTLSTDIGDDGVVHPKPRQAGSPCVPGTMGDVGQDHDLSMIR